MSSTLLRSLNQCGRSGSVILSGKSSGRTRPPIIYGRPSIVSVANYSKSSDAKFLDNVFKVVKSRIRDEGEADFLGGECGPNWEILAPKANRFFFPNAIGPAWQSATTTITLDAPLESLVDFDGKIGRKNSMLHFSVGECPSLIKKSLHEIFPAPEVVTSEKLSLITLKFNGESEKGARKFVLAAREITSRLRLHGYWADFMNPFSGKPFFSWANGKNLYKVDDRFRGLNMKLIKQNECTVISSEDTEVSFSGAIYSNVPPNYGQIKLLMNNQI